MAKIEREKIRLGVSACLLGARVRYAGGHKRAGALLRALGADVEWVPVCPEVELGLGVPRPPIVLVGSPSSLRLVEPESGRDLTGPMRRLARACASSRSSASMASSSRAARPHVERAGCPSAHAMAGDAGVAACSRP